MAEELSIISFDSNQEAIFEIEGNVMRNGVDNVVESDTDLDFNDMNREILNCLDKITNASRKQSSQSVRKEEDNSFSNLHLKGIWGEENKDDSGTFKMKFDHLKKKKVQRPVVKTKFSNKESKLENLNEKEATIKFENEIPEKRATEKNLFVNNPFENVNKLYSNSHNPSPVFNSTEMRRIRQNFVVNNGTLPQYQQAPHTNQQINYRGNDFSYQNVYKRNFISQNILINDEVPLNKMLQNNQNKFMASKMSNLNNGQMNINPSQNVNSFYLGKGKKNNNPFQAMRSEQSSKRGEYLDDESNRINLENVLRKRDKRTTVMIRHIPNKYNIKTFLEEINQEFNLKYDIFYLPIDYVNNCNLGFAFINFVDPMHVILFYERFRGKKWKRFNSEKICELAYAKFQGKKELIAHFEKGSVLNFVSEEKRPLILSTPNPLPKVEIPIKFANAFTAIYPYGAYSYTGKDTLQIEAFYSF